MAGRGLAFVPVLTFLWAFTAATELPCFVGESICKRWQGDLEAEHGRFNGQVICCPPEPHQGIIINGQVPAPDNCLCQAGTKEKYAHVLKSAATSFVAVERPALLFVIMVMRTMLAVLLSE